MTDGVPFEVTVHRDGPGTPRAHGDVVVSVRGELDLVTAPAFHEALAGVLDDDVTQVVVEAREVTFLDAAGARALAAAGERARETGTVLSLRAPSPAVRRVLDVLELDGVLPVED